MGLEVIFFMGVLIILIIFGSYTENFPRTTTPRYLGLTLDLGGSVS